MILDRLDWMGVQHRLAIQQAKADAVNPSVRAAKGGTCVMLDGGILGRVSDAERIPFAVDGNGVKRSETECQLTKQ